MYNETPFPPQKFNRALSRALGQVANQLGDRAEAMVEQAFKSAREKGILPKWIKNWIHAEKYSELDRSGIDFVFVTDVGELNLNIKSSRRAEEEFMLRRKSKIRAVFVNIQKSENSIYEKVLGRLYEWRNEKRRKAP